jgi:hypothetical protein
MTSDQLLAAASATAARGGPAADHAVVVPLHAARLLAAPRRARRADAAPPPEGTASGAPRIAQIADYRRAAPRPAATPARARTGTRRSRPAVLPPAIKAHAAELEALLREHIDVQLALLAEHAPQLHHSLETIRHSVDLLARLRDR